MFPFWSTEKLATNMVKGWRKLTVMTKTYQLVKSAPNVTQSTLLARKFHLKSSAFDSQRIKSKACTGSRVYTNDRRLNAEDQPDDSRWKLLRSTRWIHLSSDPDKLALPDVERFDTHFASQGQIMALAFRRKSLKPSKIFPPRSP